MPKINEWWYTDAEGRKIGYMWPDEFEALTSAYYADSGWVKLFADEIGVAPPTIYRYMHGQQPIPKAIASIVNMLGTLKARGIKPEPIRADWLPGHIPTPAEVTKV